MKKLLKKGIFIVLFAVFMLPILVNASSFNPSFSCPSSASPGEIISCKITVSVDNITAIQGSYSLGQTSYESFTFDDQVSGFDTSSSPSAFTVQEKNADSLTSGSKSLTIGTLKVKIPANGSGPYSLSVEMRGTDADTYSTVGKTTLTQTVKFKSNDSTLKSLSVDGMTIGPNFAPTITDYALPETSEASIKINAVPNDSSATAKGAGTVNLNYGNNTFTITVTSESGGTTKYNITVKRTDTRDTTNTLKSLEVKDYTISPAFNASTKTYSLTVEPTVTKVEVLATMTSDKSTFTKGNGPRTVDLKYGKNVVKIVVKAENEKENTYTINITRTDDRDSNNFLKSLTISDGNIEFNKNTTSYTVNVDNSVKEVTIAAIAESDKAKVKGSGTKKLKEGSNTLEVVVTAENESTRKYKIIVNRGKTDTEPVTPTTPEENNTTPDEGKTYIKSLIIRNSNITFDPNVYQYDVKLGKEDSSLDILYQVGAGLTATIEGNENLENGSVVKLTVNDNGTNIEYTFNIVKDLPATAEETKNNIIFYVAAGLLGLVVLGLLLALLTKKKPTPEEVVKEKFVQEGPKNYYNSTALVDGVTRDQVSGSMISQIENNNSMTDVGNPSSTPVMAAAVAPDVSAPSTEPLVAPVMESTPYAEPEAYITAEPVMNPNPMVEATPVAPVVEPDPMMEPAPMADPVEMEPMPIGGPIVNEVPGDFIQDQSVSFQAPNMNNEPAAFQMSQPSGLDVPAFEPVNSTDSNNFQ